MTDEDDLKRYVDRERRRAYLKAYREDPENKQRKREYMNKRYKNDPDYRARVREKSEQTRQRRKEVLLSVIRDAQASGCVHCGEDDYRCLQFHHRDPSQKSFCVGHWQTEIRAGKNDPDYARAKQILREEIEKCDVICANCHFKLHDGKTGGGRRKRYL